ncbi:sensor histidine kinase [Glycomyces albidus]|uniref:histidine kinase n=1 Tax=Glycomyces albidus TaxID=2656774 RepID=A0A6L5G4S1_9ACTN|nr:sensor domain-containing protein [Glycomyces albidus]MQM24646.1 sensor histidine kinase [Glycomyces albidus]
MDEPRTALEALGRRRLPVSAWPWRAALHLLTVAPLAAAAFAVLGVPWVVLAARLAGGGAGIGEAAVLMLVGIALIAVLGPLVSAPLARAARRGLRRVDHRRIDPRPRPPGPWLRTRYTDPGARLETAYACLIAFASPVLVLAVPLTVVLAGTFVASPVLVLAQRPGDLPVALAFGQVSTVGQTLPYVSAGLVLLAALPYLATLLAGVHGAAARALLTGAPDEDLRAELVEVSRSRTRLADAFEAERLRIERDLHDGAQQRLVGLTLKLGLARLDLPPGSPAAATVGEAHDQAKHLMAELRELIHGIRPQILTDLGLAAALGELADASPVPVTVDARLDGRLPGQVEHTAYFVAAEALTNVARHSGAASARVTARVRDGLLTVDVADDGRGGADPGLGTGLTGLADRVAVTGGRMLLSSPAGGPTVLRVELPCNENRSA